VRTPIALRTHAGLVAALLGCRGESAVARERELRVNLITEPPTLDWTLATDATSFQVIQQLMRGLTEIGPDLAPRPALAERWDVSPDGRTYTFHLRRDVRWSDGEPLDAGQFVYAWRRLVAPATAAEYAYFLFPVRGAREINAGARPPESLAVAAPDARRLVVELEEPLVYFPALTSFMVTFPLRAELIERHGALWTEPGRLVSLGPFVLESWRHDYKLALRRNPTFHGEPARVERVVGFMVGEQSTALVLFEQGLLDLVRIPPLEIRRYAGRAEHRAVPLLRGYYYGFDTRRPPFDDARVRRAFSMAIDREALPRVLRGGELAASFWIPPGMPHHNPGIGLRFDPAGARRLLAEAGVDPAALAPVRVLYNTDQTHKLVAEQIQQQWRRHLGVRVELESREWKVFLRELATDPPPVFRMGWGADFADPDNFMSLFTSASDNNHTGWADARYDRLVERAARERDPARRQRLYDEAQRLLCEREAPIAPLFVAAVHYAVSPRLAGFVPNALDVWFLDAVEAR
jgi:oligopeptide transport system substrate-binding protein